MLGQQLESVVAEGHVAHLPDQHDGEFTLTRGLIDGANPHGVGRSKNRTIEQKEIAVGSIERRNMTRPDQHLLDVRIHRGSRRGERPFIAKTISRIGTVVSFARHSCEGDDLAAIWRQQPCRGGGNCRAIKPRA